ncbi:hypothetical protein ACRC7T_17430 (plasmid) [Segnochrobactraceae bacterium EtOH-i3]
MAALADPDRDNPIAQAAAARLSALTEVLDKATQKLGRLPACLEIAAPKNALDEIVIEVFQGILDATRGSPQVTILSAEAKEGHESC